MASALLLASAGNIAFFVIFGIFVVAFVALAVIVIMWAVRHDLAGRQMTQERQAPLSRITAPTLVIHGTADPLLPLANGAAVAALIPGARFQEVPGMGHGFYSPGIPAHLARLILNHTAPQP